MNYGANNKKIVFNETDKRHAELKIRLNYEGLTQQAFLSSVITGYLECDENIMNFISKIKEEQKIHSKARRMRAVNAYAAAAETVKKFALDDKEVESIFDILEDECKI